MTDWTAVTAGITGALATAGVAGPIAITLWFRLKAQIDAAKAEAAKNSAVNSARIDQHDQLQRVVTTPNETVVMASRPFSYSDLPAHEHAETTTVTPPHVP